MKHLRDRACALAGLAAVVALLVTLTARPAAAYSSDGNDMVVFGGQHLVVRSGQEVTGDLVVIGGSADVYGRVDGDAVAIGGRIYIAPAGRINGSLVNMGGSIDNESNQPPGHPVPENVPTPLAPPVPVIIHTESGFDWGWTWFYLVDAVLTALAFLLFPSLTRSARTHLLDNPIVAGVLGFFSPIIFALVLVALAITIIGIPLIPLAIIATIAGYLVGKAAIAELLGERIFVAAKASGTPLGAVLVGLGVLFVVCAVTGWLGVVIYFCLVALAIGSALPMLRSIAPRRRPPTITPPAGPPPFSPPVDPARTSPPATQ